MNTPSLLQLTSALRASWDGETGYSGVGVWTPQNPARGQCVTSSLVVQDYFGGSIVRYAVSGEGIDETHYLNILEDGTMLDTTGQQYKTPVSMTEKPVDLEGFSSLREKRLSDEETSRRYHLLKSKVETVLDRDMRFGQ